MEKFRLLRDHLVALGLTTDAALLRPELCSHDILALAHERNYVERYCSGAMGRDELRRLGLPGDPAIITELRLGSLSARNYTRGAKQLVIVVRQIGNIAFQLETDLGATTHASPTVDQNADDHQQTDDDEPLAQTEIHEYLVPVVLES